MPLLETDPVCLALDDDHNLIVPVRFVRGADAVKQGIEARIRLIKGEVFWNRDAGVPWLADDDIVPESQAILGQPFNEERARVELRKAILATPCTLSSSLVMALRYDGATRTMTVDYEVSTTFGDTVADTLTKAN